jgi:anti-anti-sigma regulatory factor
LVSSPEEVGNAPDAEQSRTVVTLATLRGSHVPNLRYGTSFHIRVVRRDDESVTLVLLGELDITSMVQFERVVTEVLSASPNELIFDLTQSQFISAQGYAAIGRCSSEVPVRLRSRTTLASKVLAIYGYERVEIAVEGEPDVKAPC